MQVDWNLELIPIRESIHLPPPNLTPDKTGRIKDWSQEQFIKRFRAGARIPGSHMPWGPFSRMSDTELKAVYKFLQTVKPVHNIVVPGLVRKMD
jgi:hypothetical protein